MQTEQTIRTGEYLEKGDYHSELDKRWIYYPVYVEKMRHVSAFMAGLKRDSRILDVGCGEGVLVQKYKKQGFNIVGLDLNYQSDLVKQGSLLKMPFSDGSFDAVLCLDVIEHLGFADQQTALEELRRVLKPGGILYATIPNLAHLACRLRLLFTGKLIRTAEPHRHIGDRPHSEYLQLLKSQFQLKQVFGLFPSFPLISFLTYFFPSKVVWLHRIYNSLFPIPGLCFLNVYVCQKSA